MKKVHLNPGLLYIPVLFAGDSLSIGMQSMKAFKGCRRADEKKYF